jgi:hypothetical protein
MIANNIRFALNSNFTVNILSVSNYENYISSQANLQIKQVLKVLRDRRDKGYISAGDNLDSIQKKLILYSVLYERGGIILEGPLTLTENFNWVR